MEDANKNGKTCFIACCGCAFLSTLGIFGLSFLIVIAGFVLAGRAAKADENKPPVDQPPVTPPPGVPPGSITQDFWITHYDPGLGGINGRNCGGAVAKVCKDVLSPTGYVAKYPTPDGFVIDTGVYAVPQDNKFDNHSIDWDDIPVPLWHSRDNFLGQAKIIIPCYNGNKPTIVGDHFAKSYGGVVMTNALKLDLASNASAWQQTTNCLRDNNLILETRAGLNGGSRVTGYIVGEVKR